MSATYDVSVAEWRRAVVARERVTLLQRLMRERRLTRERTLDMLDKRAREMGVRDFALSLRQLDRWLAGDIGTEPRPGTCRVVEAEFGHPVEQLLAFEVDESQQVSVQPKDGDLALPALVGQAARSSSGFALWADSMRIGDLSLLSLRARLAALAHDYVNVPLTPVFRDLVDLRDDLFALITCRPDPSRLQEIYFLAGTTCAMLAYASGDLGFPRAAMVQGQAALACAEKAGNPTLTAWLLGNRAMTSEWYGQPERGLRLAGEAATYARSARVPGTVLVRLASIEARAYARMGDASAARAALDRAAAARDLIDAGYAGERDEFDEIGGILTFTPAKQHFYGGSTFLRIGDPAAAQQSALAAINGYASGPADQRSYGDEALAWVDVAAARVTQKKGDLDSAAQALDVILGLPPSMQIPALAQPLSELRCELNRPRFQGAVLADRMRDAIDDFVDTCLRRTGSEISA
jgi:hypothetical protein